MSAVALAMVLVAAVIHASWNLMLKRAQSDAVCTALQTGFGRVECFLLAQVIG